MHSARPGWQRRAAGIVTVLALPPALGTVIGFFGTWSWRAEQLAHFRMQYLVSLSIAAAILFALRSRVLGGVIAVLAIANLYLVLPLYFGQADSPPGPAIKAMLLNVNTKTGDPKRVAEVIRQIDPDILVLEEVSADWLDALRDATSRYLFTRYEPRDDNFGIALLSRFPFIHEQTVFAGQAGVPSIIAELRTPQGPCSVLATHPLPPRSAEYAAYRNDQLAALPQLVHQASSPVILLGDLNTTLWSPYFTRLLRDSRLRDSSPGRGFQPSWPAGVWMLRIPIDHCLYSQNIHLISRQLSPDASSDHLPLVVRFQIRP